MDASKKEKHKCKYQFSHGNVLTVLLRVLLPVDPQVPVELRTVECAPPPNMTLGNWRSSFKETFWHYERRRFFGSSACLSHPFVRRWHRRFTGAGGGAISGRRRCSWLFIGKLHQCLMTNFEVTNTLVLNETPLSSKIIIEFNPQAFISKIK